ncbi:glycodelin [Trichechus manatus latirostris]|uniref:Glycodelin n=1 Tax=Trichechus manatus latirostris TaxID=127582 RepID=A0A2Y9E959_TRIMA|nr:glycodelin [Trichechus manatus latirostris]
MKCLLLTLVLALVCSIYAVDIPQSKKDLDIWKLAGIWHSMAMAASDLPLLEMENAPLRVYIKEMRPTTEDKVEVVLLKRDKDACVEVTVVAQKTEDPAVFTVNHLDENKVFMLDTDYKNFLFTCMDSTIAPEQDLVCQYLARTLKVDTNVMEQFKVVLKT